MLFDGMKRAQLYILKLIQERREALGCLFLGRFVKLPKLCPYFVQYLMSLFMRLVMIFTSIVIDNTDILLCCSTSSIRI